MNNATKKLFTIMVIMEFLMRRSTKMIENKSNRLRDSLEWGISTRTPKMNVQFTR